MQTEWILCSVQLKGMYYCKLRDLLIVNYEKLNLRANVLFCILHSKQIVDCQKYFYKHMSV